ncbi:unnamed protein product, partial [Ectocarpus sp. 12 AP-2014]
IWTEWLDGCVNCVVSAEARFRRQNCARTTSQQPCYTDRNGVEHCYRRRSRFEVDGRKLKTATPFVTGVPINLGKVLLTEEFDEGLMVLRRLLRWEMVDMT